MLFVIVFDAFVSRLEVHAETNTVGTQVVNQIGTR
jgi:hypothetical protein